MARLREGLRQLLPKPKSKPQPKTNAERCRSYSEKLKKNPEAYEEMRRKNKEHCRKWRANVTPEQAEISREKARLRQQRRRERLKQERQRGTCAKAPETVTQTRTCTRKQALAESEKREKARLRQQKRRLNMSSQKKRREREKRMERYYRKKGQQVESETKACPKKRLFTILKTVKMSVKSARSKAALVKLDFVKRILARQTPKADGHSYYKRPPRHSCCVEQFFEKVAVDYPGQRGASACKKVLTKPMVELLQDFKKLHPGMKMSLTTFKRRRPRHIFLSSSRKFLQCLCEKCTNTMLLADVLNTFVSNGVSKMSSPDDIVRRTVCTIPGRSCFERTCSECGVDDFVDDLVCTLGENVKEEREWKRWEKTERFSKELVVKHGTIQSLIVDFKNEIIPLAKHVKTAQWQREQYQFLTNNLPVGHAVLTVDFAENYVCKYQNEIQSAHWSYRQVSVHPCVFFYRCKENGCFHNITDYIVFLSDDLKHDAAFTKRVMQKCIEHARKLSVVCLHIFSDGCGSQYKSKLPFWNLTELQHEFPDVKLTRHFFGSSHGKSLCDSCGGTVKNCATRAVASGSVVIQGAEEMLAFCMEKLALKSLGRCTHTLRTFSLIKRNEIDRSMSSEEFSTVKGTQSIHSLLPSEVPGVLKARCLSCFCMVCLLGESGECENVLTTLNWNTVRVLKFRKCSSRRKQNVPPVSGNESDARVSLDSAFLETPDTSTVSEPAAVLDRQSFFQSIQKRFESCKSFVQLHEVASETLPLFHGYPLPTITSRCVIDFGKGTVDAVALQLVPPGLDNLYPLLTDTDGNCVPRALSLLVFGDQLHHVELRCRIVAELACNSHDYLSVSAHDLNMLCKTSEFDCGEARLTFEHEILSISKPAVFMGMWQLMAASNVIGAVIVSVYPSKGPSCFKSFFNRRLKPKPVNLKTPHALVLLWSTTRSDMPLQYWTANHVVPLLPLYLPIEIEYSSD